MIVKMFKKHGSGKASSCKACVDYLLNKPNNHAQVLQGDPRLSQDIADSLDFTNTYTAGCLSFEEKDLPEQQKREIMQRFEQTFFSGLDPEQYNIAWVQHTDKGRLELNFVIPNVELTTGKRLQPYYDKADRPLAENFKQVINHEYGLTDPNSPEKKQTLITKGNLPKEKKQALNAINSGLESLIRAGKINNREDVINALQNAGFEIARITPKNISIKTDGQNLRLKGAYYEQSFRYGDSLSETIRENARKYERDSSERYQTARNRLKTAITARKQQFKQRYPSRAKEIDQGYRKSVEISDPNTIRLMAIMLIVSGGLAWYSKQTYQELQEWQNSMEVAKEVTNGIKLSTCKTKDGSKPCVVIDTDYPETWGENYKILKLYEPKNKKTN